MNTTINVSTGFTPFYMLYGTQVALPIDHALSAPPISIDTSHVANMKKIVQEIHTTMAKEKKA